MKNIQIDGKEYTVFRRDEYSAILENYGKLENMLVARRCVECGDWLLGEVEAENSPGFESHCEEGHCGSRPGVWY